LTCSILPTSTENERLRRRVDEPCGERRLTAAAEIAGAMTLPRLFEHGSRSAVAVSALALGNDRLAIVIDTKPAATDLVRELGVLLHFFVR